MKFKLIITLWLLISTSLLYGQSGGFNVNPKPDGIPLNPPKPRPKDLAGELQQVYCYYLNGMLTVEFEQPEGRATMTVTRMEDGVSQTVVFYTFTTFSYNIGTAPGSYVINVKTSQCEYEGFLTIE